MVSSCFDSPMMVSVDMDLIEELLMEPIVLSPDVANQKAFVNLEGRMIKGKRCQHPSGCFKRAQSQQRCKAHGGGSRCQIEGCAKASQGNKLCRSHGGGKVCAHQGCLKGPQRNGLCYAHGGSLDCTVDGCTRKARGRGRCFTHGGGKRCAMVHCTRRVQRGNHCALHLIETAIEHAYR